MIAQYAVDPALPNLTDVIEALRKATLAATVTNAYEEEIRRATARVLVERLMTLAGTAPMPQVRALASRALQGIQSLGFARPGSGPPTGDGAAMALLNADIRRFLERPIAPITAADTPDAPPGAPIGDTGMDWLARVSWCGWGG
jgi:hypothetical protein